MAVRSSSGKRRSPARKSTFLRRLESSIPSKDLVAGLSYTGDPRCSRLVEMMCDPAYRRFSFPKLCERAGISGGDVLRMITRHRLDEAISRMVTGLGPVIEDLLNDARATTTLCPQCQGQKVLDDGESSARDCLLCLASGEIRVSGDQVAQRLLLELTGLIGPSRSR